jgi:ABC-2 type transport system permease protein
MTVATTTPAAPPALPRVGTAQHLGRLAAAEWTKLRTVRSTMWTLVATVLVCVGLPLLFSLAVINTPRDQIGPDFDGGRFSLLGVILGQLVIGSLGVLVMSAEYSTGTIRASLTAAPQRIRVLVAKAATFAAVIAVVAFVTTFAAFWSVQALLGTHDLGTSLGSDSHLRMVVGAALYLVAVGLLGLGVAAVVRSTAVGISVVVGLLFVLPVLTGFLPQWWQEHVVKFLPGQAGVNVFMNTGSGPDALEPWPGLALFAGYAVLALVVGGFFLARRDA